MDRQVCPEIATTHKINLDINAINDILKKSESRFLSLFLKHKISRKSIKKNSVILK